MKKIGIITAMKEEFDSIEELLTNIKQSNFYNLKVICGNLNYKEVVLAECGIGKVNAARTTQILIDKFDIDYIINVGVAGGLNNNIEIGDIVIGKKLVQHDFDITAIGHPKGYISKELGREFISDLNLINKCEKIIRNDIKDTNVIIGTIATGDVFCNQISLKEDVVKEFEADCIEMEGAAIAQVCTLCNIPFIVIRSISDKPNGHNEIDFSTYLEMSVKRYQKLIKFLV